MTKVLYYGKIATCPVANFYSIFSINSCLFSVNGNKKIPFKLKFDVDFTATLLSK